MYMLHAPLIEFHVFNMVIVLTLLTAIGVIIGVFVYRDAMKRNMI